MRYLTLLTLLASAVLGAQDAPKTKAPAKKAKAAAALLAGPEPKGKPTKADDRKVFEEARKIPDNGS